MPDPQHDRRPRAAPAADGLPDDLPPPGEVVVDPVLRFQDVSIWYGDRRAVADIDLDIPRNEVTAMIGPSGCGKSTLLRAINRMNDLIPGTRLEGRLSYHGEDLYDRRIDPVMVRQRIGMVFQKPNPFPRSIRENVLFGPKLQGIRTGHDEIVEVALRRAALWDEVKDGLGRNAMQLSGGQQQRLCIARAIATDPDVILMDEPCSALDPLATLRIEELMRDLTERFTILVVTHNMQQAARASDRTAFLSVDLDDATGDRSGRLVEFDRTELIFTQAKDPRTEAYITGRYG